MKIEKCTPKKNETIKFFIGIVFGILTYIALELFI